MKSYLLFAMALLSLFTLASPVHAADQFRLESEVYVYRTAAMHEVAISGNTEATQSDATIFKSPASAGFGTVALTLEGDHFSWNGGPTAPSQFNRISVPAAIVAAGQQVTVRSSAPAQYMEKQEDGTMKLREISADSPDAPHCQVTFTISSPVASNPELPLTCELDVATVASRENVPGVALEVGKPQLASFKEDLKFAVQPSQWAGVSIKGPNGSDYSLLVLVKVAPVDTQAMVITKVGEYHLKTPHVASAAVTDGKYIYVTEGRNPDGILGTIERFDVKTHEVTTITDKLRPRHHHGAALVGGKIYVFGGGGYDMAADRHYEGDMQIYDIATGQISDGPKMPTPRAMFATAVLGTKIYAIGGTTVRGIRRYEIGATEIYDTLTNTWSEGVPLPLLRETRAAVVVDGCIIVIGGYHPPVVSEGTKSMQVFVPEQNKWFTMPELADPAGAHAAAFLGDSIYIFGDFDPSKKIQIYNMVTHKSQTIKRDQQPASLASAVTVNDSIYVIGGAGPGRRTTDGDPLDDIQEFKLEPVNQAR